MTRAEICLAACEGLTDDEVKAIVANGGLAQLRDTALRAGKIQTLAEKLMELPSMVNEAKGNLMKARPILLQILTEMEDLER